MKTLPEHGAYTPFLLAVRLRQAPLVEAILKKREDTTVDEDRDEKGRTGFFIAVQDNDRCVRVRIAAMLGGGGKKGETRVAVCCWPSHRITHWPSPQTPSGWQPNRPLVDTLLAAGADVNVKDHNELTPLLHAVQQGNMYVCAID